MIRGFFNDKGIIRERRRKKPYPDIDKSKKQTIKKIVRSEKVNEEILDKARELFILLDIEKEDIRVNTINRLNELLHEHSLFKKEPVDCIRWVSSDQVVANDYNPNVVAPPEMQLLEHSILQDGYTQPIVTWRNEDGYYEVVDGFHRNRVGKECKSVSVRIRQYLPVVVINQDRREKGDRIAATIRHNRARGKHQIQGMVDIVIELKKRNWSDKRIGKELGMDEDEVLRLCQMHGLIETFSDIEFSKAWEAGIFDDENLEGEVITE